VIKIITLAEGKGEELKKKRGRPKATKTKSKSEKSKESTPKKASKTQSSKGGLTASEIAAIAETEARAAATRLETAKAAAEEAAKKEYEAAAAEVVVSEPVNSFTNKRGAEQIFRREMGEPEFWLDKLGRAPKRPILSQDEEQQISRQVEIPTDQTPEYKPEHMLSPEFNGTSNYEIGIKNQREETQQRLVRLQGDPNSSEQEIKQAEEDLKTLDYLYENFNIGMNVFRTAKGGRAKLRE
jgi:colicin import membrane protein